MDFNGTDIIDASSVKDLIELAKQNSEIITEDGETIKIDPGVDITKELEEEKTEEEIIESIVKGSEDDDNYDDDDNDEIENDNNSSNKGRIENKGLVSVISYLADKFDIDDNFLQSDAIKKEPLQKILDFIYEEAEDKILEKNSDKLYKSELSYQLDNYLSKGGNIQDFFYEFLTSTDELGKQQEIIADLSDKELLYADFINKGFSEEEAIEFVEDLEKKGKLGIKAKNLRNQIEEGIEILKREKLNNILKEKNEVLSEIEKKEYERIEQEKVDLANKLSNINSIYNFPITEEQKEELFEFITETDKDGYTGLDKALQSNENLIFISFLLKYGNNFINYLQNAFKERSKKIFYDKLLKEPIVTQSKSRLAVKDNLNVQKLNEF
jgi:hypothetical protein